MALLVTLLVRQIVAGRAVALYDTIGQMQRRARPGALLTIDPTVISADANYSTAEVVVFREIDSRLPSRKNGTPMEVIFAVLADSANVSMEGKLNILGNFTNINAGKFPARHPEMQLVVRMEASAAEIGMHKKMEMQLLDEDGGKISGFSADFDVPKPPKSGESVSIQLITRIVDTVFPKAGRYGIYVLIDGKTEARIPLTVG